jgi:hypothetical protein
MYVLCLILLTAVGSKILPFSSIKMKNDDIYVSIDPKREKWHQLLSINSIGSDAIVSTSKTNYGTLNCDGEIECYKFNIIVNFEEVYKRLSNKDIPKWVPMEFHESDSAYQNGMDVESTETKYEINKKNADENIKLSKGNKIFTGPTNSLFKGIADKINKIFNPEDYKNVNFLNTNLPENSEIKKEIKNMKNEIEAIEKQELEIEKVIISLY